MVSVDGIIAIVLAVFFTAILLLCFYYLLVHYQHPDDKNSSYFAKMVVLFGLTLAGVTVLGFPLDIMNKAGYVGCDSFDPKFCIGLDMQLFWNIIFWAIPIWIFVLIPFSTFYYEADDEDFLAVMVGATPSRLKPRSKFVQALCSLAVVLIIVILIFGLTYLFFKDTKIPVEIYKQQRLTNLDSVKGSKNESEFILSDIRSFRNDNTTLSPPENSSESEDITLRISFSTFFAGLMAWVGWFFFAIFGGVGLPALPLDLILGFINRPRYMNPEESSEAKAGIQKRINEMVEAGEQLKRFREESGRLDDSGLSSGVEGVFNSLKDSRSDRKTLREFKAAVFLLEKDVSDFTSASSASEKYNPLLPWIGLFAGVFSSVISLAWICHIAVFLLPPTPISPFLNAFLMNIPTEIGIIIVSIFTFYLLLCAIKGCFKFGLRFLCMAIHPMEHGKTYMSSFMFNVALILICCLPVIQFCTQAFSIYAQFSTARQLFGVQIENLLFFSFFWRQKIFIYAMFAIMIVTVIWLILLKATKRERNNEVLLERLRGRS